MVDGLVWWWHAIQRGLLLAGDQRGKNHAGQHRVKQGMS